MAEARGSHVGTELSAYLDGQLSSPQRAKVEAHLAACGECRGELASLRHTVGLLRQLPPALPRRSFALPAEAAPPLPRWLLLLTPGRLRLATGMAGLLLVAVIVADLFRLFPVAPAPAPPTAPPALSAPGPALPAGPVRTAADAARPEGTAAPKSAPTAPEAAISGARAEPAATASPSAVAPAPQILREEGAPGVAYRWPVRQLELALFVAMLSVVALLLFVTWRRVRAG